MAQISDGTERHRDWHTAAGRTAMLSPDGTRRIIWDLDGPDGLPAQIEMSHVNAAEAVERGGGRYTHTLPIGMVAGALVGSSRLKM
jgi:hypothetical protein